MKNYSEKENQEFKVWLAEEYAMTVLELLNSNNNTIEVIKNNWEERNRAVFKVYEVYFKDSKLSDENSVGLFSTLEGAEKAIKNQAKKLGYDVFHGIYGGDNLIVIHDIAYNWLRVRFMLDNNDVASYKIVERNVIE